MKSKIFSVLFALVLVVSFSLVAAVPAAASPLSGVSVELYKSGTAAYDRAQTAVTYYIYFTPGADLTANVDTITVRFPAGTSGFLVANTSVDPDGDSASYAETACTVGMVAGYNLQVTTPKKISAGTEAYLTVTTITNPTWTGVATTKAHTLVLYTSQETTEVTSAAYTLGTATTITTVEAVTMDPVNSACSATEAGVAGAADDWRVTFTATTALTADWDTITVTFPPTVYVPSSINKAYILVEDDAIPDTALEEAPTIVGQSVTMIVPTTAAIAAADTAGVWFKAAAGIKNPTVAQNNNPLNVGDYIGKVKTSKDSGIRRDENKAFADDILAATASVVGFAATSANQVLAGVASANITVQSKDTYGNLSNVPADVSVAVSSSSTTALFDTDLDTVFGETTDSVAIIASGTDEKAFQYKDSVVGTATITASYVAMDWTPATWDIEVMAANVVYLYDGTSLIGTYTTITAALADAMPAQTVKVPAGTYSEASGETFPLTISTASVTLESIDGAATTIIEGPATVATGDGIIKISAVSVVLGGSGSGFTIKGKTDGSTYAAVLFPGASNLTPTVQGNILTGELTGYAGAIKDLTGEAGTGSLVTIRDNIISTTVKSTAAHAMWLYPQPGSLIDNNDISGFIAGMALFKAASPVTGSWTTPVTVSNNTVHGNSSEAMSCGFDYIVFSGNDCYENLHGIQLSTNSDNAKIVGNNLYNNEGSGLRVKSTAQAEHVYVFGNNIYGNTATVGTVTTDDYGIWNQDTTNVVPAKHNWWGDASGPYHATTNPTGTGDKVSTYVTYSQWLTAPIVKGAAAFTPSATSLTGETTAGVDVTGAVAASLIGAARYTVNPRAAITAFTPLEGGFFEVFVEESVPTVELITMNFYPSGVTADSEAWYWSTMEGAWVKCSEQDYSALGFVWVKCRQEASVTPPATLPTAEGLFPGVQFAIGTEVSAVTLSSIAATPASVSLDVDGTQQLTVTATYSDASTADVTAEASYESSVTSVATVSTGGLITGVAEGDTTITVSYETKTDTVSVTVSGVFDPWIYDEDEDGVIDKTEALTAVTGYFAGDITKAQALEVITLYFTS